MIGRLHGKIIEKQPPEMVLDVQGVGYEILLPMTSFYDLPQLGEETTILHILSFVKMHIYSLALPKNKTEPYSENSSRPMALAQNLPLRFCLQCLFLNLQMQLRMKN